MSAIVGQDWRNKTLTELFIQWQAVLMETWHHTANIKGALASGKVTYEQLHPYMAAAQQGFAIKPTALFDTD
jgi:hypothetical protein